MAYEQLVLQPLTHFRFTDKAHSLNTFLAFLCNAWDLFDEMPEPKTLFYSKNNFPKVL
jgi:hypothetical protein